MPWEIEKIPKDAKYIAVKGKKGTEIDLEFRKSKRGLGFYEEPIKEK